MSKGFKKLPFEMRNHLAELTASELKVWVYYHLKSDRDNEADPANQEIAKFCDMNVSTVKTAKRGLKAKGWLHTVQNSYRLEDGTFTRPTMMTKYPWLTNPPMDEGSIEGENSTPVGGKTDDGLTDDGNSTPIVYTGFTTGLKTDPSVAVDTEKVEEQESRAETTEAESQPEDSFSQDEYESTGMYGKEWSEKEWLQDFKAWVAENPPDGEERITSLASRLGSTIGDPGADPLDAYRIMQAVDGVWQRIADSMPADLFEKVDWEQLLTKIFMSPRWKKADKTLHELRFRMEAEPHDGATLGEQLETQLRGKARFLAGAEKVAEKTGVHRSFNGTMRIDKDFSLEDSIEDDPKPAPDQTPKRVCEWCHAEFDGVRAFWSHQQTCDQKPEECPCCRKLSCDHTPEQKEQILAWKWFDGLDASRQAEIPVGRIVLAPNPDQRAVLLEAYRQSINNQHVEVAVEDE